MHEEGFNISLKADHLFDFLGLPISNTFLTGLVFSVLLFLLLFFVVRKFKLRPSKFQVGVEFILSSGYDFTKETLGDEKLARKVYPLIASLFIVILFFNLAKFIPGMESITFGEHHLFKSVHSDFNMTFALGVVAWVAVQFLGVFILGLWKYSGKFIQFKKVKSIPILNPIGILEIISEVAKMISLSFRLFVNILVGGILIMLLQKISHFGIPVLAMLFEVFVAFLQAGVFALLTLFYIKLATDEPH